MKTLRRLFAAATLGLAVALMPGLAQAAASEAAAASAPAAVASAAALPVQAPAAKPKEAGSAKETAAQKESLSEPLSELPASRVWIVLAVILLMAGLFWALLYFQQRIEQAGYFGRIYHDTFRGMEAARLGGPVQDRWLKGAYLTDILLGRGKAGEAFHALPQNRKPEAGDELRRLSKELGWDYELRAILHLMEPASANEGFSSNPFGETPRRGSRTGMLGSSSRPAQAGMAPAAAAAADGPSQEDKEDTCSRLRDAFAKQVDEWLDRASASAWNAYQEDVKQVEERAELQANEALQLTDFSALRGRGPEFVLEFTAVVVIIFAAVILSVLGRLDNNQVGTLLAAIAGYVLGKGASRTRAGAAEDNTPAAAAKDKTRA